MERHPNYLEYRAIFDNVVRDILAGKLEHIQNEWHCGTAHCVRGWFEVKASKLFHNQDYCPVTEMFVDADGSSENYGAIFKGYSQTITSNTEKCGYLTGYDVQDLLLMFRGSNTHDDIRYWAQRLGIDLSNNNELNNVKNLPTNNVRSQVVRVTPLS